MDEDFYGESCPVEKGNKGEFVGQVILEGMKSGHTVVFTHPQMKQGEGMAHGLGAMGGREKLGVLIGYFKRLRSHTNDAAWDRMGTMLLGKLRDDMMEKGYSERIVRRAMRTIVDGDVIEAVTGVRTA